MVRVEDIAGEAQSMQACGHKAGQRDLEVKVAYSCNYDNAAGSYSSAAAS